MSWLPPAFTGLCWSRKPLWGLFFLGRRNLEREWSHGRDEQHWWEGCPFTRHQLQIEVFPIFLMELDRAWSCRNERNLLHCVSDSLENPELGFGENVGKGVVNQKPQEWELGSALL